MGTYSGVFGQMFWLSLGGVISRFFYMQGSLHGESYHFSAKGFNVIFFFSAVFSLISGIINE